MKNITEFQGEYRFLSNFWPASILYGDILFPTTEHAYQAAKTIKRKERIAIAECTTPGRAKRLGAQCELRSDWDYIKLDVMRKLLVIKFQIPELQILLLATGDAQLEEGNKWGDTFWGVCNNVGENHLGKLLMAVRTYYQAVKMNSVDVDRRSI